jgi:hypothetical protein
MIDRLWVQCEEMNSHQPLMDASDEEIVRALFNAPQHPNPKYFGYLRKHRKYAIAQYQQLFYHK